MYATKLLALIKVIWLRGSQLTYVANKLMNFLLLAKQGVKVNWSAIVFNNLCSRLRDLSAPTKLSANRDNTKFGAAQVVDILLWNWFLNTQSERNQMKRKKELLNHYQKLRLHEPPKFQKHTHKC
jgi:hypothetical protein